MGGNGLSGIIQEIQEAADKASWSNFVKLLGGVLAKRKQLVLSLHKEPLDKLNQYLEPVSKKITGITDGIEIIKTRFHKWVLKYKIPKPNKKALEVDFRALAPMEFCQ